MAPPRQASWVAIAFIAVTRLWSRSADLSQKYAELGNILCLVLANPSCSTASWRWWRSKVSSRQCRSRTPWITLWEGSRTLCHVICSCDLRPGRLSPADWQSLEHDLQHSVLSHLECSSPRRATGSLLCRSIPPLHHRAVRRVGSTISGRWPCSLLLVVNGRAADVSPQSLRRAWTSCNSCRQSAIYFTFSGQFMFFELMSEMKDFTSSPRPSGSRPFQVSILLVGSWVLLRTEAAVLLGQLGFRPSLQGPSPALFPHHRGVRHRRERPLRILYIQFSPFRANDLSWREIEWARRGLRRHSTSS